MVYVPVVKHLLPQPIIQESLVIALFGQVEASNCQHDLVVLLIVVDQVRLHMALGLLVGDALDDPVWVEPIPAQGLLLRVLEVRFIGGEDYATDTWDKVELIGRCCWPRGPKTHDPKSRIGT